MAGSRAAPAWSWCTRQACLLVAMLGRGTDNATTAARADGAGAAG
jgi:hypothetical protein